MLRLAAIGVIAALALTIPSVAGSNVTASAERPLRLVLDRPLEEGGKTRVRLRNRSDQTYIYNSYYQACYMRYFELPERRQFIIPEGTHCDLVDRAELGPGETVTLFRWDLDECVEDNWGCTKAKDLRPGRYLMKGRFKVKGEKEWDRVRTRFRIRA